MPRFLLSTADQRNMASDQGLTVDEERTHATLVKAAKGRRLGS